MVFNDPNYALVLAWTMRAGGNRGENEILLQHRESNGSASVAKIDPEERLTEEQGCELAQLFRAAPELKVFAETVLLELGKRGANANTKHPDRQLWEAARAVIARVGK